MSDGPDDNRKQFLRRGRWVEVASLAYNLTEVAVSLTAGFISGSSALISWGMDSLVESTSAGTLIWRLTGEMNGIGPERVERRKKVALTVLAIAFTIAVGFILYEAIGKFFSRSAPEFSGWGWWGIGILVLSLVVNPFLAWGKHRYGKKLDAPALRYDAIDTLICQYQTVVALVGLGLSQWLGWWWADPVAALLIVPYVAWEGFEAARDAWKTDPKNPEQEDDQ
jgi:divalent metal cation (Fe/Co/Zn/Cd) transporter